VINSIQLFEYLHVATEQKADKNWYKLFGELLTNSTSKIKFFCNLVSTGVITPTCLALTSAEKRSCSLFFTEISFHSRIS
jgi:hypothetical protein